MTPASSQGRASDAGSFPAARDSYRGPSGRHERPALGYTTFSGLVASAAVLAAGGIIRRPPSHHALCLDMPGQVHDCAFETRMRDRVLVRPTGERVGL